MKMFISLVLGAALSLVTLGGFAADEVMHSSAANWMCTTNASAAETEKDKAADERMADKTKLQTSADAFRMAEQNCRDCTKITCETVTP